MLEMKCLTSTSNTQFLKKHVVFFGGLAQLARAPALQAGGQEFDSPHLHQLEFGYLMLKTENIQILKFWKKND